MTVPSDFDEDPRPGFEEEFGSIPWDALVRPGRPDWRRLVNLGALALAVAAIAALTVRTLWPAGPSIDEPALDAVGLAQPASLESVPPAEPIPAPEPESVLTTEADLMALDPGSVERAAAAYAEWFAAVYFTVDGTHEDLDSWSTNQPPPTSQPGPMSYVESVTALAVERIDSVSLRVTVVVRTLSTPGPEEGYRRDPVRAVSIPVAITPEGLAVADLPAPVSLPELIAAPQERRPVEISPALLDDARTVASLLGDPADSPYDVSIGESGAIRVAFVVTDETGLTWPVAIWLVPDGMGP
jgi:hypothetical protein